MRAFHGHGLYGILLLVLFCLASCQQNPQSDVAGNKEPDDKLTQGKPLYAERFSISSFDGYQVLEVKDPWKGAEHLFQYVLVDSGAAYTGDMEDNAVVIQKPIKKAACFSTTYISSFAALDALDAIGGLANTPYIYHPGVRKAISDGAIADLGNDYDLDYERLVALQPDVIFIYAVNDQFLEKLAKLEQLGLTVVLNAEYLEQSPLGQAEWIKFMAAFLDKSDDADRYFNRIEKDYQKFKSQVAGLERPTVMCNLPWKGTWYLPGGKSFTAQLIADAGGQYLWHDDQSAGSLNLDFEVVYSKAAEADVWINPGDALNLSTITSLDEKHAEFAAFQSGRVFNHYRKRTATGGNDYFESGTISPHLVLRDMIKMFHPEVAQQDSFTYYLQLPQ